MAKEKMKYVCEMCGREYYDIKSAETCESSHYKSKKVIKEKYNNLRSNNECPTSLVVELQDKAGNKKIVSYMIEKY